MVSIEPFIRRLKMGDIPAVLRLKDAEGWNQTEDDLRLLLEQSPEGCFAMERAGEVIATSTAVPYRARFGWVGMMLVASDQRRRGYGARLLDQAIAFIEGQGLVPALDATSSGKLLYDQYRFLDLYRIERRVGTAPDGRRAGPPCAVLAEGGLEEVLALDRDSFGDDRASLLGCLLRRKGAIGLVCRSRGGIDGYLLGRPGARFFHLGPWVSKSPEAAGRLLDAALSTLAGLPVGVDVPAPNARARALAAEAGLSTARALVRMARPAPSQAPANQPSAPEIPPGGRPDRIYGLAGLELG